MFYLITRVREKKSKYKFRIVKILNNHAFADFWIRTDFEVVDIVLAVDTDSAEGRTVFEDTGIFSFVNGLDVLPGDLLTGGLGPNLCLELSSCVARWQVTPWEASVPSHFSQHVKVSSFVASRPQFFLHGPYVCFQICVIPFTRLHIIPCESLLPSHPSQHLPDAIMVHGRPHFILHGGFVTFRQHVLPCDVSAPLQDLQHVSTICPPTARPHLYLHALAPMDFCPHPFKSARFLIAFWAEVGAICQN